MRRPSRSTVVRAGLGCGLVAVGLGSCTMLPAAFGDLSNVISNVGDLVAAIVAGVGAAATAVCNQLMDCVILDPTVR